MIWTDTLIRANVGLGAVSGSAKVTTHAGQQDRDPAYEIGYRDGASVAREDAEDVKPYNPQPRGRYDDLDHGYRREYGSKSEYKARYADGYREGYRSAIRR